MSTPPIITLRPLKPGTARHNGKDITLTKHAVYADDIEVGKVFRAMATRERRTRGNTYVDRRWTSPAWYYQRTTDTRCSTDHPSRREALKRLLHEVIPGIDWTAADALARDAKVR